jgi:hypothetical protein
MPKLIAKQSTWLKSKILGATDLAVSEKVFVPAGKEYFVNSWSPDRNQHDRFVLASSVPAADGKTKLTTVYGYAPHFKVEGEDTPQLIKLPVKYMSQLDNDTSIFGAGWRQCCTTSHCMMADYLLAGEISVRSKLRGFTEPESLYMRSVGKYGDTTDVHAQVRALSDFGIECYFSQTLSAKDLLRALELGIAVPIGVRYKSGGHWVVVVGHDPVKRCWYIHDPYGARHAASDSYDIGVGGAFDIYSYDVMQSVFFDMGSEAGWGTIATSVKGEPTGVMAGM